MHDEERSAEERERELAMAKRLVDSHEWKWFVETYAEHLKEQAFQQLLGATDMVAVYTARGGYAAADELINAPHELIALMELEKEHLKNHEDLPDLVGSQE